ncbi:hypothetical protein MRX96_035303 [Rhipicephalus microplus]
MSIVVPNVAYDAVSQHPIREVAKVAILRQPSEDGALYAVEGPTLVGLAFIAARTVVGLLASVLVRTAVKAVIYPLLCSVHGCDPKLESSRQKGSIELPYKYITYLSMGLTMSLGSPWLFHLLGIQRESLPVHI